MAFWNAPLPNKKHAAACVRAAIDAQRTIYELNLKRVEENQKREMETTFVAHGGAPPKPQAGHPDARQRHQHRHGHRRLDGFQRTPFELHRFWPRGESRQPARIGFRPQPYHIGEATYKRLLQDDPELAATCISIPPLTNIKGISRAVIVYEVPWRPPGASPFDEELFSSTKPGEGTSFTGIIQRESN